MYMSTGAKQVPLSPLVPLAPELVPELLLDPKPPPLLPPLLLLLPRGPPELNVESSLEPHAIARTRVNDIAVAAVIVAEELMLSV